MIITMSKNNITKLLLFIVYGFLFISSTFILIVRVFIGYDFATGVTSGLFIPYLQYFTSLSNFYNGFVSLAVLIYAFIHIKDKKIVLPKLLKVFALTAALGVTVTFLIIVTFLVFVIEDKQYLFSNELLFFHIINPLLTAFSFILLLRSRKLVVKYAWFGFILLFIYSIFYSVFVILGVWNDFYNFTFGGHYWTIFIFFPAIIALGYGLSFLFIKLNNKYFYPYKRHALILLGGKGTRMGKDTPKQFLTKNNKPLYLYAVERYSSLEEIDDITLVVAEEYIDRVKEETAIYPKVQKIVKGGNCRARSSFEGLSAILYDHKEKDCVLIADAVRVNTSEDIIYRNILALEDSRAVLTAIVGEKQKERIDTSHTKNGINYLAQTPQSFRLGYIMGLYFSIDWHNDPMQLTDDITLVKMEKQDYEIVLGSPDNYKITRQEDFDRFLNE